ncbi:MAG: universal stress protein [Pseudomonadota bacterium]|jgi:nucleotide-binding universal stress UspA family protein|nr:universal stress protein [Pseudomonadota bacterium]
MYQRILVPVDGSSAAAQGLHEAIKLAHDQGAQILLLHVVDEWRVAAGDIAAVNLDAGSKALRETGAQLLTQAEAQVRAAGIPVQTVLLEELGVPVGECIVRRAQQWPADLIVCGTHGRHGVSRLLLGSSAEYIVRHTSVPVLLVREAERNQTR